MLQKLIESLADNGNPLEDGLRQLLVIAYRTESELLREWVEGELEGYADNDGLPNYRRNLPAHLKLQFTGYGGSSVTAHFIDLDIPEELRWWGDGGQSMRQSVTELTALAQGEGDPGTQLPNYWVKRYQDFADKGQAAHYTMMFLNNAHIMMPRTMILGVLGNVRNRSLKMALELESVSPKVGSAAGANSEHSDAVQRVINVFIERMTGDMHAGNEALVVGKNSTANIDLDKSSQYNENAGDSLNFHGDRGIATQTNTSGDASDAQSQ